MFTFKFNGVDFSNYGIVVETRPELSAPYTRMEFGNVDGYNGAYTYNMGLSPYEMTFPIVVQGFEQMREVTGLLRGRGYFTRSDLPHRAIEVFIEQSLNFTLLGEDYYRGTVTMITVDPLWYLEKDCEELDSYDVESELSFEPIVAGEEVIVRNSGTAPSTPIVHIFGSGEVEFSLNDAVLKYTFPVSEGNVRIDCETYKADYQIAVPERYTDFKRGTTVATSSVGSSYEQTISSGTNAISGLVLTRDLPKAYVNQGYKVKVHYFDEFKKHTGVVNDFKEIATTTNNYPYCLFEVAKIDGNITDFEFPFLVLTLTNTTSVTSHEVLLSRRNVHLEHNFKFPKMKIGENKLKVIRGQAKFYIQYKDAWY